MDLRVRRRSGTRQITAGLGALDGAVFEAVANSPSPLLDATMPRLTRAADHSKLWFVIAAALIASRRPSAQRGAVRGVLSLAASSLITNQVAKRLRRRRRPSYTLVPLSRQTRRHPTSNSLPSGHSASAAAFAVGAGLENAPVGFALALLAGLVGLSRIATGAHYPGDVFIGFGIGAGVAVLGGRLVPPIVTRSLPTVDPLQVDMKSRPDGAGVVLVVNPASGGGAGAKIADEVRSELPAVEVVEVSHDDVDAALRSAAQRAEVLAIAGGDGSVSCAAGVAVAGGVPRRHLQPLRQGHRLRLRGEDHPAIKDGTVFCVDLVCFNDDDIVVNTASIGAYPRFVQTRERLEHKVTKPVAMAYAMLHTLRHDQPVRILRQPRHADVAVLPRQIRIPAFGFRAVATHPVGRRLAGRPDPRNRPAVVQAAHPDFAAARPPGTQRAQRVLGTLSAVPKRAGRATYRPSTCCARSACPRRARPRCGRPAWRSRAASRLRRSVRRESGASPK